MDSFKVKKLPDNFAETVLNLELDVEQTEVPLEAVNQLIELYAVEKKNKKELIFINIYIYSVQLNIMSQFIVIDF